MKSESIFTLETKRLILSSWFKADRQNIIALYADPLASRDFGRALTADESSATFDKYIEAFPTHGFTRWKLTLKDGTFIGTTGVMRVLNHQALGTHDEIGWRLLPDFWGNGYATEAARAAQDDVHTRCRLRGLITYTSPDNPASSAVMKRLGYIRTPERDFSAHYPTVVGEWRGHVWKVPDPA